MNAEETILDRYIAFSDRAARNPELVEELRTIFSADATIQLAEEPITGIDNILPFYRGFFEAIAECQHYWTVTKVDDRTLEAEWVAALRFADGRLGAVGGRERATLNADGLITHLRNFPAGRVRPGA